MRVTTVVCSFVAMTAMAAPAAIAREPRTVEGPPGGPLILVQSELDLLPAAKNRVTLQAKQASPSAFLDLLRKESGLTIEVEGKLPERPVLSGSFHDAQTKELLDWFADRVPVSFRAEPPNKLWIVVDVLKESPPAKVGS